MAASDVCPPWTPEGTVTMEGADTLHERLVAYVHALSEPHEARTGVWMEHSYARGRGGAGGSGPWNRVLLATRASPEYETLDVERLDPPPPVPPDLCGDTLCDDSDDTTDSDDQWEARVVALAPTTMHARLAERVIEALHAMRLARLAGAGGGVGRRQTTRTAARRLRLAFAPLWLAAAGERGAVRAPAWLHGVLRTHLPRASRLLYDEAVQELVTSVPRLGVRLGVCGTAVAGREPSADTGPPVSGEAGPWLVWVGGGAARWARRLGALVYTRVLSEAGAGVGVDAAPPEAWCAAVAGAARAALVDVLAEAGDRGVFLCGAGAGAALCVALAGGALGGAGAVGGAGRVRGLALLAPPLLTAEGARDSPDDPLHEIRLPMLLVVGSASATCWGGAARGVCAAGGGGGGGERRLLEVRGADAALRVSARARARLRVSQRALDATVAEECARWVLETNEAPGGRRASRPRTAPPRADDEEYAHLPPTARAHTHAHGNGRAVEIMEGRVVSRVSGGTPLALMPPRRVPASTGGAPAVSSSAGSPPSSLAAADIMRLPIVFADDDRGAPPSTTTGPETMESEKAVTVTSGHSRGAGSGKSGGGAVQFTRVIVAKRGNGAGVAARAGTARGSAGGTRPVLLRRGAGAGTGVRLVRRL